MRKNKFCFLISLFFTFVYHVYADERVLSPVPGVWANKQSLVVELNRGDEVFYSMNGSDPAVSGFAYDGPVLIDLTGAIELRVVIYADGRKDEINISYSVEEKHVNALDTDTKNFFALFSSSPVIPYTAGDVISVPAEFSYGIGKGEQVFIQGSDISMSDKAALSRFIPFTITDGVSYWRHVIYAASVSGVFTKRYVPFNIVRWNELYFKDKRFIYSVDGGQWISGNTPVTLDRAVFHKIRWQSVVFNKTNTIQTADIPPMPMLQQTKMPDGSVTVSIKGETSYRFGHDVNTEDSVCLRSGLFPTVTFDTFKGDIIEGNVLLDLYADGVYQGGIPVAYTVDKRPPAKPIITSSSLSFLSREDVKVSIETEEGAALYCATSIPERVPDMSGKFDDDIFYKTVHVGDYKQLFSPMTELKSDSDIALFFKLSVFAEDAAGNKSVPAEYSVIIDPCNYYFDALSDENGANGTQDRPYTSLIAFKPLSKTSFVRLHIKGKMEMAAGKIAPDYDCEILGSGDAELVFVPESSYAMKYGSFAIKNCLITKTLLGARSVSGLFFLENSVLNIDNCVISVSAMGSTSVFSGTNSVVSLSSSSIVSKADDYADIFSLSASKVMVKDSRVSAVANTSVVFSLCNSHLDVRSSDCMVVSQLGKIAELRGGDYAMVGNTFTGGIKDSASLKPVWKDAAAVLLEYDCNKVTGFGDE